LAAFGLSAGVLATGPVQRVYSHVEYVGGPPEFDDLLVHAIRPKQSRSARRR
jgi:hypothetical protein